VIPGARVAWTPSFVLAIAYVALAGTALPTVLWIYALGHLPVTAAGIATLLTPLVALALSRVFTGETPGTLERVGIACIALALAIHAAPARRSG
jgi:drug/metabolite transporter (DMT)-like permease